MKKLLSGALAVLVFAVLLLSACGNELPTGAIVAVGDGVVTQAQFDQFMDQARAQASQQKGAAPFPSPGTPEYDAATAQLVDYLVLREIVRQGAEELRVEVSDDEIDVKLEEIYKQYGGQDKVVQELKKQNMTEAGLRTYIRDGLLAEKVRAALAKGIKPTEEQLREFYEQNKEQISQQGLSYEQARPQIEQVVAGQLTEPVWQKWVEKARKEADLRYAPGYDPSKLTPAASPAAAPSAGGSQVQP